MATTVAISDMHFGAWTGDAVLKRDDALGALAPLLESADELVLLGDVFDFLFSSVENAFAEAEGFFDLVADTMRGRRVVFLAGNHDHHIVVRALRSLVELKVATGAEGGALARAFEDEYRGFFDRFLARRLAGVETRMAYPVHRVNGVLLTHGHHLDAHMGGSVPNRLLTRAVWTIAGGRPRDALTLEDYESVIVPLTELLFTVAQMPRGTAAQMSFHHQFERMGRALGLAAGVQHALRGRRPAARDADPSLGAFCRVARNLGWASESGRIVFAHTHRPLDGVAHPECPGVRFWNTGSWIHEPAGDPAEYARRAWPGTAVVIDGEAPRLVRLLEAPAAAEPLAA